MSMTDLAIRIATTMDSSGLNKADKGIKGFEKSIKKLGKTLGITLSAAAIVNFGKKAAQAFIQDQKEATRLAQAVKNLGLQFSQGAITDYIDKLSMASGVADSQLRPAMQTLLQTTSDVAKSQQLLAQAIDISAGSGIDLQTVTQDLAYAYVGNTKGLKKYNLGLTQAQLKTAKFADIQGKLNTQFKGANAAYLNTYAGKMQILTTAAGEAQEVIGGALIDSLMDFTGAVDAADLAKKIGDWSKAISNFIGDFTWAMKKLYFITSDRAILESINPFSNYIEKGLAKIDAQRVAAEFKRELANALPYDPANNAVTGYQRDKAAAAAAAKRAKAIIDAQKKNTAELKKQTALKKLQGIFDLEQIQLVAALKGKLSAEERIRVEAMLALANGNLDLAKQLTDQILKAQDSSGNLAKFLAALPNARNPFEYLDGYLSYLANKAAAISTGTPFGQAPPSSGSTTTQPSIPATNVPVMPSDGTISYNVLTGLSYNPNAAQPVINVTVQGNVIREEELINKVLAGAQLSSLSGSPSQIGRISGMFG